MCNKSTQTLCNAQINDNLHWRATTDSFRLTTVKTQHLFTQIRSSFVNLYFPVESQKLYLSRTGFVIIQNWKKVMEKKPNSIIIFPFYSLFKYATVCVFSIYYKYWYKTYHTHAV